MTDLTHRTLTSLLCLSCLASVGFAQTSQDSDDHGCAAQLEHAKTVLREAWSEADHRQRKALVEKARKSYQGAFADCDSASLSLEEVALLADHRGAFLATEKDDLQAALIVYRKGLIDITAAGGIDQPARIRLLEGEAEILSRLAQGKVAQAAEGLKDRMFEDLNEAYRLRIENYGEHSLEAAIGLRTLAIYYTTEDPSVAEKLARRALEEMVAIRGLYDPQVLRTVSLLRAVYTRQGLESKEQEMIDLHGQIFRELERRGVSLE